MQRVFYAGHLIFRHFLTRYQFHFRYTFTLATIFIVACFALDGFFLLSRWLFLACCRRWREKKKLATIICSTSRFIKTITSGAYFAMGTFATVSHGASVARWYILLSDSRLCQHHNLFDHLIVIYIIRVFNIYIFSPFHPFIMCTISILPTASPYFHYFRFCIFVFCVRRLVFTRTLHLTNDRKPLRVAQSKERAKC